MLSCPNLRERWEGGVLWSVLQAGLEPGGVLPSSADVSLAVVTQESSRCPQDVPVHRVRVPCLGLRMQTSFLCTNL